MAKGRIFTKGQKKKLYEAGYKRQSVSYWDRGVNHPRPKVAVDVSRITGVSVRTLLGIPLEKAG